MTVPAPKPVRPASWYLLRAGFALVVIAIIGIFIAIGRTGQHETSNVSPPPASETSGRTEVQWADYDPTVQDRIDGLEASKDCPGLQTEFDTADANNTVTQNRTGHTNAKLMMYIDEALRAAGCY